METPGWGGAGFIDGEWFCAVEVCSEFGFQNNAIVAYKKALARDPYYSKAWYNLGLIQAQMLGQTMAEMGTYLDPADSSMDGLRALSQMVSDAFFITVKSELQQSPNQPKDSSGEADMNLDEEASVTNE